MMAEFERVAAVSEISEGGRLSVVVDDTPVLLVRVGSNIYAIEDACSHDGQPLADGAVSGGQISCPRHGAKFDLATGKALCMPATEGVRVFEVELRDGAIFCRPASGSVAPATLTLTAAMPVVSGGSCGCSGNNPLEASGTCSAKKEEATEKAERSLDEKMLEALRQVIDPELFVNIVDLGLVYSINYDGDKAYVDMTLTSPMCPAGPQLVQQAKMALERLREVNEAVIKIVMTPPWSPDRMTDEARDQLGIF